MTEQKSGKDGLEGAYALSSPDDNRRYYGAFAATYESGFAVDLGYRYPEVIAGVYRRIASAADRPIADIGCGTGMVGAALNMNGALIDGFDISPEMLAAARAKSIYRDLFEADMTRPLTGFTPAYGAVLSAGTFTFGHLGPGPLRHLLALARSGALFVIGVNQKHFDKEGFAATLAAMEAEGGIGAVTLEEAPIYDRPGHDHSDDKALILQYRKT